MFTTHFADDQVIIAKDKIDISYMIRRVSEMGI